MLICYESTLSLLPLLDDFFDTWADRRACFTTLQSVRQEFVIARMCVSNVRPDRQLDSARIELLG